MIALRGGLDNGDGKGVQDMSLQLNAAAISPKAMAVLSAYNTDRLRDALMSFPERIFAARKAVTQARQAAKEAEMERAAAEAELAMAIAMETDEKGKPRYSNVELRAHELNRRKASDPGYLRAAARASEAEARLSEAQDRLQMLLDQYQSHRIVARLIASELAVIAEIADPENGFEDEREVF